jgi:hypothetical protein
MPSRELRSSSSAGALGDLLAAAFAALLLHDADDRPTYLASPWLTDFPLFPNSFQQFSALFPEHALDARVPLSACLVRLARRHRVRVITAADTPGVELWPVRRRLRIRRTSSAFAPQGVLTPLFYLDGALNLTGGGVYVRGERAVYHAGGDEAARAAIDGAYPAFERLWECLS